MSRSFGRAAALCVLIAATSAAWPVAVAVASDASIRASLRNDVPRITASQARIEEGLAKLQKSHSPAALIRAVRAQDRNLEALRRRLSRQRSSSSRGARGKRDAIRGLTLIVHSNDLLTADLRRAASGRPVSKRKLAAAIATDRRGNREMEAGAKLLKV